MLSCEPILRFVVILNSAFGKHLLGVYYVHLQEYSLTVRSLGSMGWFFFFPLPSSNDLADAQQLLSADKCSGTATACPIP